MKKINPHLLISLLCIVPVLTQAQRETTPNPATDTIQWHYGDIQNVVRSEKVNISGHFISYGGKELVWVQDGVDRTYKFEVSRIEGEWTDAGKDGGLVYQATCLEVDGTIRISRRRKNLKIELDFVKPDKRTPHLTFEVDTYTKL